VVVYGWHGVAGRVASPPGSNEEDGMARCETCGNDYDKAMTIRVDDGEHVFDSFECAIHALAPACERCGVRVVGHGVQADGSIYCCAHCAEGAGVSGLHDRV
jgi:hypothetical protein